MGARQMLVAAGNLKWKSFILHMSFMQECHGRHELECSMTPEWLRTGTSCDP